MGGHFAGAGQWYDARLGVLVHADGFDISKDGEILDGLTVECTPPRSVADDIPPIRLHKGDLGLLSNLRPVMSRRRAEAADEVSTGSAAKFA